MVTIPSPEIEYIRDTPYPDHPLPQINNIPFVTPAGTVIEDEFPLFPAEAVNTLAPSKKSLVLSELLFTN